MIDLQVKNYIVNCFLNSRSQSLSYVRNTKIRRKIVYSKKILCLNFHSFETWSFLRLRIILKRFPTSNRRALGEPRSLGELKHLVKCNFSSHLLLAMLMWCSVSTPIVHAAYQNSLTSMDHILAQQLAKRSSFSIAILLAIFLATIPMANMGFSPCRVKELPEDELVKFLEELMVASREAPSLSESGDCSPLPEVSQSSPITKIEGAPQDLSLLTPKADSSFKGDHISELNSQPPDQLVTDLNMSSASFPALETKLLASDEDTDDQTAGLWRKVLNQNSEDFQASQDRKEVLITVQKNNPSQIFALDGISIQNVMGGVLFLFLLAIGFASWYTWKKLNSSKTNVVEEEQRETELIKNELEMKKPQEGQPVVDGFITSTPRSFSTKFGRKEAEKRKKVLWTRSPPQRRGNNRFPLNNDPPFAEKSKVGLEDYTSQGSTGLNLQEKVQRKSQQDKSELVSNVLEGFTVATVEKGDSSSSLDKNKLVYAQERFSNSDFIEESLFQSELEDPWKGSSHVSMFESGEEVEPYGLPGESSTLFEKTEGESHSLLRSRKDWFAYNGRLWVRGEYGIFSTVSKQNSSNT